ncbi:MAG: hypothetical protein AAGC85_20325 [Bacteroidota bacterium]
MRKIFYENYFLSYVDKMGIMRLKADRGLLLNFIEKKETDMTKAISVHDSWRILTGRIYSAISISC